MSLVRPLVTVDAAGAYAVDADTAAWLAARPAPLRIVACVGKFRTGKSTLLNAALELPPGEGFGVGHTVQACTRGIWLCTRPLRGADGREVYVLDTEGIDALDATSDHDVRILALAVLLSAGVVFNTMSHLDEAAVQTLALMTRVAEAVGGGEGGAQGRTAPPALYWVLRDFALQLSGPDGAPLTHAAYLEQALAPPPGGCPTRAAIRAVFAGDRHPCDFAHLEALQPLLDEARRGAAVA